MTSHHINESLIKINQGFLYSLTIHINYLGYGDN